MDAGQFKRLTRIALGIPCGELLRQYWQPAALVEEFNLALNPRLTQRLVKGIQLPERYLVLFKVTVSSWGLLDRHRRIIALIGRFAERKLS